MTFEVKQTTVYLHSEDELSEEQLAKIGNALGLSKVLADRERNQYFFLEKFKREE